MRIKLKPLLFAVSLFLNGLFIFLFVLAAVTKTSFLTFPEQGEGYVSAAAVVSFPRGGEAAFGTAEINLKPRESAFMQFSAVFEGKQLNVLVNALYDPQIISVKPTGYGIIITALAEGSTLMQTITNEGIKDVALVTVKQ